jgi:hypothetical protein
LPGGIVIDKPDDLVPYAYRHSYAQRHADAGVPLDVLRDLMGHSSTATTEIYYRVTEKRTREAIDRVSTFQFDRHGNRIWRQAEALLDDERARMQIGQVAVPYGICTEPTRARLSVPIPMRRLRPLPHRCFLSPGPAGLSARPAAGP